MNKKEIKEYNKQYYLKNKEKINLQNKLWRQNNKNKYSIINVRYKHSKKGKLTRKKAEIKYRQKNKLKLNAKSRIGHYINRKQLTKDICAICGTDKDVQAHHENYELPLSIIWLCRKHHQEVTNAHYTYDE
jgi:hypothetical protein